MKEKRKGEKKNQGGGDLRGGRFSINKKSMCLEEKSARFRFQKKQGEVKKIGKWLLTILRAKGKRHCSRGRGMWIKTV